MKSERIGKRRLCLLAGLALVGGIPAASAAPETLTLPDPEKWATESAEMRRGEGGAWEVVFPVNYPVGRVASPPVPAREGELFTFAAEITTAFPPNQTSFYRFWLSLEFLAAGKVIQTAPSGEIVGVQEPAILVGTTGIAPAGATHVRAVLQGQNKYWAPLKNLAVAKNPQLLKLSGKPGGPLRVKAVSPLATTAGARTATLAVEGDWPDGTAVLTETTAGSAPKATLLSGGKGELTLAYAEGEVGSATVTARVGEEIGTLSLPDPYAGTLKITSVLADGLPTPVLARLTPSGGKMLPGRYQASVPGVFLAPPWTVELAPGEWKLEISRGPQFEAFKRDLQIGSGKSEVFEEVSLERRVDLRKHGWYGGDADGDVYHGERIYTDVTTRTAAEISQAMGLDWVGVGGWGDPRPRNWADVRARARELSSPHFLFMWTEEQPKTVQGHACFLGMTGPDEAPLGAPWSSQRPLDNYEVLYGIRARGGATFVNHPLRWWMKGERFNTNMYSSLAFDLCAAAVMDGYNINEGEEQTVIWSMLLDQGYQVAATAGADFCLDRPSGPPPGKSRMYLHCPEGATDEALSAALRNGHTLVSTGPVLIADIAGAPPGSTVSAQDKHSLRVKAWARGDETDPLQRLELYAHGKVIAERALEGRESADETFEWQPTGEMDWVSVRVVSKRGWAMSSAFYAEGKGWHPKAPLDCELTLEVRGLDAAQKSQALVEIWDRATALEGAERLREIPLAETSSLKVPVTATVVVRAPGKADKEARVFDALGVRELIDRIAGGEQREKPLKDWSSYQEILDRCQSAKMVISF